VKQQDDSDFFSEEIVTKNSKNLPLFEVFFLIKSGFLLLRSVLTLLDLGLDGLATNLDAD